jgi:sugar-specific transcriptional regulator TrmB
MYVWGDERRAVEELQEVGLTEYEAKCFAALSRIPSGTAKDVSEQSDIPRTRVYDLAESLQKRGLVEIRDGNPREFRAVSTDLAITRLRQTYNDHLDAAADALRELTTPEEGDDGSGIWTVEGQDNVIVRGQYVSARAEDELFGFFTEDAVFQENCFRQAQNAIERGVRVVLGSSDDDLRAELRDRFPEAIIWSPSLDWQTLETQGSQLSRFVMADRNIVMLASITAGADGREETAIWGEGEGSELLLLCRQLLGPELDAIETDDDASELPL